MSDAERSNHDQLPTQGTVPQNEHLASTETLRPNFSPLSKKAILEACKRFRYNARACLEYLVQPDLKENQVALYEVLGDMIKDRSTLAGRNEGDFYEGVTMGWLIVQLQSEQTHQPIPKIEEGYARAHFGDLKTFDHKTVDAIQSLSLHM